MDSRKKPWEQDEPVVEEPKKSGKKKIKKEPGKLKRFFSKKRNIVIVSIISALLIAGVTVLILFLINRNDEEISEKNGKHSSSRVEQEVKKYYDSLTGELISYTGTQYNADGTEKKDENGNTDFVTEMQAEQAANQTNFRRINCVQIPNGTDARPQVGLRDAKIVYEAIAEGGITRFAAIFRGTTSNVIGPVRSLRTYYLEWDTPYDCTIIHAGGEAKALTQVQSYPHLSESATYMWRDYSAYYAPNNLFTSAGLLDDFNRDNKYERSDPKTFPRVTPDESNAELKKIRKSQTEATEENPSPYRFANDIYVHITASPYYNVRYTYEPTLNSYLRFYETGEAHVSYTCKNLQAQGNAIKPQRDCGEPTQVAPKVVVVIKVPEGLNQENLYREDITTTGSGDAWVFENGIAIEATWQRNTINDQLVFIKKDTGKELKLAPGQTFITAVAESYGYVQY